MQNLALNCLNEMCLIDKVIESVLASGDNILKLATGLAASTNIGVSSAALQLLAVLCVNDSCRATVFENKGVTYAVTLLSRYVLTMAIYFDNASSSTANTPESASVQRNALRLIGR